MLLTARDTADRLGIKLDTLYAYVSRGLLHSVALPGSRQRRYRVEEVERLRARRGSDRRAHGAAGAELMPVIGSSISLIEDGRLYYRGRDAIALAATATLEEVALILWAEEAPAPAPVAGSLATPGERPGIGVPRLGPIERCQTRLAALAAEDFAALDLTRQGIVRTGRTILAGLAAAVGEAPRSEASLHRQLAAIWRLDAAGGDLVRRCLVLLADHELNASTFVARCVASTGATPYAVVTAALCALSGRRHGGATARAEALLHEIVREGSPMAAMAARLARDDGLPGMGHPLYPEGDPRADAILAALAQAVPEAHERTAAAVNAAMRLTGRRPNVDFALAAATTALGLPQGTALGLFIVGRAVGWIAHAIEQYESGVLIRPRARYTGPRPQ